MLLASFQAGLETCPVAESPLRVGHRQLVLNVSSNVSVERVAGEFASPDFQMQIVGAFADARQSPTAARNTQHSKDALHENAYRLRCPVWFVFLLPVGEGGATDRLVGRSNAGGLEMDTKHMQPVLSRFESVSGLACVSPHRHIQLLITRVEFLFFRSEYGTPHIFTSFYCALVGHRYLVYHGSVPQRLCDPAAHSGTPSRRNKAKSLTSDLHSRPLSGGHHRARGRDNRGVGRV